MSSNPSKVDIHAIFNRLRSIPTNKSCFDCGAHNPTWSSVTYGVFICIDCSAVHRSLGVHLSFVRSTNLDTNWTWLQIRGMQLGGNANASQFFRQHNCNTTDAQQKYNSRAAQLYKDKLSHAAQNAMKVHGTELYIDQQHEHHNVSPQENKKEIDFFAECEKMEMSEPNDKQNNNQLIPQEDKLSELANLYHKIEVEEGAPSVDFLDAIVDAPKQSIGVRKIQPKKSGIGAKKGLGATKVKANFADIEQKANLADQVVKEKVPEKMVSVEEQAEQLASVRLAYQDLSIKQNKEEEKLKAIDPNKAKQMERLGMGFNRQSGVSHSMMSDMKVLTQEGGTTKAASSKSFERDNNDFFDDYSTSMYSNNSNNSGKITPSSSTKDFSEAAFMGFETIDPIESKQTITTMFSSTSNSSSTTTSKSASISDQPMSRHKKASSSGNVEYDIGDAAQKKFGNAKGISSDQFFEKETSSFERSVNLTKFQGSTSISSSDYFGTGQPGNGQSTSRRGMQYNTPDLDEVKESVRQGVTKVAGRLSSLASDVMSSIQDKYGY